VEDKICLSRNRRRLVLNTLPRMRRFAAKAMKAKVDDTDVVSINPEYYERSSKVTRT